MKGLRFPLAVLLLHAWLFPWLPELRSPNELSRLLLARAIVDHGTLTLDAEVARWGRVGDLAVRGGHLYCSKAPGVSFAAVPAYAAVRALRGEGVSERAALFFARLLSGMVPAAVAAQLLRRILERRFPEKLALAGATVFALGTVFWPYSTFLMSHGPQAAALVACWYFLDRARQHPESPVPVRPGRRPTGRLVAVTHGNYPAAGLCAGLAVLCEYPAVLGAAALAAYGLASARHKLRASARWLAGFAVPIAALAAYHWAAFGSPLRTAYSFLDNPVFTSWHARGLLGVGAPRLDALVLSFLDPYRGLLAWSPFLALALPGFAFLWRRDRALAALCGGALALYAWFTASFTWESWGWTVGPRHLVALSAFLVPPALEAGERLRNRGLGVVPAALALLSIANVALTMAVCPYLPDDLRNPIHQLVVPLARMGLRSHDLLGMALGTASPWTLLPWLAGLVPVALLAAAAFLPHGTASFRASVLSGAVALAAVLFLAGSFLGGPDRFEVTRRFVLERFEPRPGRAPGLFAPP